MAFFNVFIEGAVLPPSKSSLGFIEEDIIMESRMSSPTGHRAPTVSEIVDLRTIDVRSVILPPSFEHEKIKPDFDTDVLWKPPMAGRKMSRGLSTESTDSETGRRISVTEISGPTSSQPIDRPRRMSFTEMIFGSPGAGGRGFSWGERSYMKEETPNAQKTSVTEDLRFKEIMRHQNKILNDDGGLTGFKVSDYRKNE